MAEPVAKPRKDEHTLRLTTAYTDIAQDLAGKYGESFSGILTRACEMGLDALYQRYILTENKRLISRRLVAKERGAVEALATLRDPDALPEDREAAIAKIEEWLRKG